MAEEKRTAPDDKPRRRPAPTIDLTATEVSSSQSPPPGPAPEAAATKPESATAEPEMAEVQTKPAARPAIIMSAMVGLVAGAAVVFAGLWGAGVLQFGEKKADDISPRLAALDRQIRDLSQRPQPQIDTKPIEALAQRIDKMEQAVNKPPAAIDTTLTDRMSAIEGGLAALNRKADSLQAAGQQASAAGLEGLVKRLDALEQGAKTTQDKIAQNSSADIAARQALASFALRDAVARNTPYAAELDAVKSKGGDAQAIAALEPFAASGLASDSALSRELAALVPTMIKAVDADVSRSGGFVERLQANASKLVRVHPVGEPSGEDAAAVLARIEVKLGRNDIVAAQQELAALPAKARAIAEPWIKKVSARNAALAASRKLAADSAAALAAR